MRRILSLFSLLAVVTLAACELDEVTVPTGASRPVLHLVLNPFGGQEIDVLLERTLGGRVPTTETAFDSLNPIVSGGGEPILGARVRIFNVTTNTDSATAVDVAAERRDGTMQGVYRFIIAGCSDFNCPPDGIVLTRGQTYEIRVDLPGIGNFMTGRTTIPDAFQRPDTGLRRVFNVGTDTYVFSWPAAEGDQPRYALQVQTPYGPFQTFASAESLAISGGLRNFQAERFPRVFVPGFIQALQSLAVDRNYFDYYRSENSPFTGQGLINRLEGGLGVFGAVIPIRRQDLDIVAPFDEPLDGVWVLENAENPNFAPRLTTWADGQYASGKLEDPFDAAPQPQPRRALLGTRAGSTLRLAVLDFQQPRDTAWTLEGTVQGNVLVTTSPEKGQQTWRRLTPAP